MDLDAELERLELALARRDEAAITGGYEAVLDESFVEVGRSGRLWSRETMVAALRAEPRTEAIVLSDFTATELSPGVFLVRYETVIHGARTHRTSIWLRSDQHLRLRFHQGTPAATDA